MLPALLWRLGMDEYQQPTESPSLAGMRHSAWILSNLVRDSSPQTARETYESICGACALLVQSPDVEVLVDVCTTLTSMAERSVVANRHILELAIVSRLVQLVSRVPLTGMMRSIGPQITPLVLRKASVRTIAAILRAASPFEISVVLNTRCCVASILCDEIQSPDSDLEVRALD